MQVNSVVPNVAAAIAGHAGLLLLPDLLSITSLTPQAQALRECRADRDEDDRARREDDSAQQLAAADNAAPPPTATELMVEAERDMAPGSHAARRQLAAQEQHKSTLQQDAFQRSLADAAARQNAAVARANANAASQVKGECQSTETAAPQTAAGPKTPPGAVAQPHHLNNPGTALPLNLAPAPALAATATPESQPNSTVAAQPPVVNSSAAPAAVAPQSVDSLIAQASANCTGSVSNGPQTSPPVTQAVNAVTASPVAPTPGVRGGPASTAAEAPPRETGKSDANFERILRVLRAQISQNRSHTTLQLDPPELGKIRLHLDLRDDALTLRVEPQTQLAHRLLSGQLDSLREGLNATGVHLEHVEIRPPETNAASETFDLPPHAGGGHAGGGAEAETDHPQHSGTDSPAAGPPEIAAREANSQPSAEPRVNIWA